MKREYYGGVVTLALLAVLMLLPQVAAAGGSGGTGGYDDFYLQSLRLQNRGMLVLGTWAVANMATGAYGWKNTTGEWSRFHQMNLFWNVVNGSIAGIALYSNLNTDLSLLSGEEMMGKHLQTEKILLINAGLDVLYMGGGLLMRHMSTRSDKYADLLKGYGNSVIMQGAFLFVFDLVLYAVLSNHRTDFLPQLQFTISPVMTGFTLTIPL